MYIQSFDSAPRTCFRVQAFGSRSAWFWNVGDGGVNGQAGRIIEQVIDCFTVARRGSTAGCERILKALGDIGGRCGGQQRSLKWAQLMV